MATQRQIIPRTEDGKMETTQTQDDIMKYADEVACNLLEMFPDIDFFDLENIFYRSFRFAYSRALAKETAITL